MRNQNFSKTLIGCGLLGLMSLSGCTKDDKEIDTEYPTIDVTHADAFPKQCSVLTRGETIVFKALLKDNMQLGSYSIDIHHNFDHHSHSTEVNSCEMDPIKGPVNPFLYIKSFPIPDKVSSYQTNTEISIPGDIDPGDYHFMIMLTDAAGWQTIKGLSIKIK
ncbi:DUF4625 domain-containing protein [Chitinophaga silvatica]|uniref:DUF4625 domain-containing protein n=1 Tax=Chitinophaga silvatica TaxID=2282649 RepID=A0A3E1Y8T4_9BACT|nr:DUF4625 domain-containing protein [Chitinophaga silvatica]RFS21761.1 DUF4625 domain-containing protein [Chitinophaga silvatica]